VPGALLDGFDLLVTLGLNTQPMVLIVLALFRRRLSNRGLWRPLLIRRLFKLIFLSHS
jgi:hypothetical protein